jgi:nitric oxide synthase-interacting protein
MGGTKSQSTWTLNSLSLHTAQPALPVTMTRSRKSISARRERPQLISDAKHNTTQSTLTHYERSLLRRQNEARRLGHDSFKPLDHCNLCLSNIYSRDPVSCPKGHIYCKECVLTNLITQKASIEASKRELERWEDNEARERYEAKQKARERVISNFEKGMGLGQGISGRKAIDVKELANGGGKEEEGRVQRLLEEAENKALKVIEEEQLEARKSKLAAFWLPSLAPEAKLGPVKDMKLQTMCHVGGEQHPIS